MKMRKSTVLLLLLLMAVSCLALGIMAPNYVERPEVQKRLKGFMEANAPSVIKSGMLRLKWLPLPHLEISDIAIASPQFTIEAPRTSIYPNWFFMLPGASPVSKVEIFTPDIRVVAIEQKNDTELPIELLPDTLVAHNATVRSNPGIFLPGLLIGDKTTTFTNCSLQVVFRRRDGDFHVTLSGDPGYAEKIEISLTLNQDMKRFGGWARFTHLDLNSLFSHYISRNAVPVAKDINLFLSVSSSRTGFYEAALRADTPCVTLPAIKNKTIEISCGVVALDIHATPQTIDATILKFDLESPHINLAGDIHLDLPGQEGKDPLWDIILKGRDIDLKGVREVVLNLFGHIDEAKEVCNIVRGGKASTITYVFRGNTSDFESLDHMLITAEVDKAPIYIPDPDLFLDEASGPIKIERGTLYGNNLTARIGKSRGWNGTLELGLSEDLFQFSLGLDLEADVSELKPLLQRLIDHPGVVNEIRRFHNVKGTAVGSLKIGDDLRDFNVLVNIERVNAQGFYDRLRWPVRLTSGKAHIGPHSVSWEDVTGYAGKSRIRKCTGDIAWQGKPFLNISKFRADVDTSEFLDHLLQYPELAKTILSVVTGCEGRLLIHSAHLSGPAFAPDKWQYSLNASPDSVSVHSPLLPKDTTARSGKVTFSHKRLIMRDFRVTVAEDPMMLSGDLRHHLMTSWSGRLNFSGTYDTPIDEWVGRNGWRLPAFELNMPCALLNSSLEFDEKGALFVGHWLFNKGKGDEIKLSLERYDGDKGFEIKRLGIETPTERAVMAMEMPSTGKSISFSWNGRLSANSVRTILVNPKMLQGEIDGDFSFVIGSETSNPADRGFSGQLDIAGLKWIWGVNNGFLIKNLTIRGHGKVAEIQEAGFDLSGDTIEISGTFSATPDGMEFDIDMDSELIHQSSIEALTDKAPPAERLEDPNNGKTDYENPGTYRHDKRGLRIRGNSNFSFGAYILEMESDATSSANATRSRELVIKGLQGSSRFFEDGTVRSEISKGQICGVSLSGSLLQRPGKKKLSSLLFKTPKETENSFEEITSCINRYQNMIQGPLTFEAGIDMNGTMITNGHIDLVAHHGKISRFTMLSRIFSIVNLVDLLGKQGWQELTNKGLAYSLFRFRSIIEKNILKIEEASIYGNGLNIFATGDAMIHDGNLDLKVVVAPLKTIDAIVTNIPIIGKGFGGKHNAFLTIPVSVKGNVDDPDITVLPVKTFTDIFKKLITGPIKGPYKFIKGLGPSDPAKQKRPGGAGVPLYDPETQSLIPAS